MMNNNFPNKQTLYDVNNAHAHLNDWYISKQALTFRAGIKNDVFLLPQHTANWIPFERGKINTKNNYKKMEDKRDDDVMEYLITKCRIITIK